MATTLEGAPAVVLETPVLATPRTVAWLRHAQFGLLCATLIFSIMAFGAVERWSMLVLQAATAILLVLWAAEQAVLGEVRVAANPLYLPMGIFGLLVFAQLVFGVSGYRYATFLELLNYLAFAGVFFVAAQVLRWRDNLKRFVVVFAVFGFLLAVFAMVHDLTTTGKLYFVRDAPKNSWPYGPFVNHANYAGLMELLVAFPLAVAVRGYWRENRRLLAYFAAMLMGLSIFLSVSRGGIAAFVAQVVFLGMCVVAAERSRRGIAVIGALLVVTAALLVWVGAEPLLQRTTSSAEWEREVNTGRWAMTRDSMRMVADRPLLGWGAGVFPVAFPRYRSYFTDRFTNAAHNDYAQLLVETGIIGFALGIWFLALLYRRGLGHLESHPQSSSTLRFAALVGCTGIVVHSLVDFNMHIPANAAMFFVLAAIASGRSKSQESGPG